MKRFAFVVVSAVVALLVADPSFSQAVAYSGKLQIGFGDQSNVVGVRLNNAVPHCAGAGELVNPGTIGTTLGTLVVNAEGSGVAGVGGSLTFHAVGGGKGGAQQKFPSSCLEVHPGFANPRLRSRTQIASAHFPGRKGPFTPNIHVAPVPTTPTATYMLSALGGNLQPATVTAWTTMASAGAPAVNYTGNAIEFSGPLLGTGLGVERIQPGPARFGGAIPYSGTSAVHLGVNFTTGIFPRPQPYQFDYGTLLYMNGLMAFGPQFFGTDAKGINILSPVTTSLYTASFSNTVGLLYGRHDLTFAARTPGGTTKHQQGAIRTVNGGNTVTPGSPPSILIVSPIAYSGFFGEWTTGRVTHTDKRPDFSTIRRASGFDIVPTGTTKISQETRRLQVVTPWAARVQPVGPFGLPVPTLGFGGIAALTVNIIPAPEPSMLVLTSIGSLALVGFRNVWSTRR